LQRLLAASWETIILKDSAARLQKSDASKSIEVAHHEEWKQAKINGHGRRNEAMRL
jgi:hypothetical protein